MSYSKNQDHNYRGRGKKASRRYQPRHSKKSATEAEEQLLPIDTGAIAVHLGETEAQEPRVAEADDAAVPETPALEKAESAAVAGEVSTAAAEPAVAAAEPVEPAAAEAAPAIETLPAQEEPAEAASYSRSDAHYKKRKRHMSGAKKAVVAVLVIVFVAIIGTAGAAFAYWRANQEAIQIQDDELQENLTQVEEVSEPYWTLILGSDSRSTDTAGTRSDVILLARIDQANKQVTLVSIPRDTRVLINGSYDKINAAYAYGGATEAVQTVEEFAGVKISHYVEIYFKGFSTLVDDLGGVEVDVPELASYHGVTVKPGLQTLNGKQALTVARTRKTYSNGDFSRTNAQRILVMALAKKVLAQDATQIPNTITSVSKCFKTDMPLQDVISLALSMQGMDADSMYSVMAPSTTGMLGEVSYTFTYINQWKLIMQKAEAGEDPTLTKKEIAICGESSTHDEELDMSMPLSAYTTEQLEAYWEKKAAKEKAKHEAEIAAQSEAVDSASASTAESVLVEGN